MLTRLSGGWTLGIWIDRFGYQPGSSSEPGIEAALGEQPLTRSDGRIAFYDLTAYIKRLKMSETSSTSRLAERIALGAVVITFPTGFYAEEHNDKQTWRWSSQHSVMRLHNPLPEPHTVQVAMILQRTQ